MDKPAWKPSKKKERFCSFPHRHGETTGKPETRDETHGCRKTSISRETSSILDIFDALSNRLECHKVPRLPRLPRKTTWQPAWKPSRRRGFAASPIDTARPQENQRLETRHVGAAKTSISCETSAKFDTFDTLFKQVGMRQRATVATQNKHDNLLGKPSKRKCFAASPIDTARPQENQRLETRHMGAEKRAFRARRPPFLTFSTRYQTGWNVTKCHACHAKTTWQPAWKPSRRRGFAASPIDTARPQENQRLETRHVGAAKRAFRARLPLRLTLSTRYQTGWNATKCHACHAKTTWQPPWKPSKRDMFCSFPHRHGEATGKPETRDETHGCRKTSISRETSSNFDTL